MPKEILTESSAPPKQTDKLCPRFSQKKKRTENKKQRLAEALRGNLLKRKEQMRARAKQCSM